MPLHPAFRRSTPEGHGRFALPELPRSPTRQTDMAAWREESLRFDTELHDAHTVPADPVHTIDVVVPVVGAPDLPVRLHYPWGPGEAAETRALPGYVCLFGGGFREGGIDYPSNVTLFRRRAREARVVVIAPDYALAPEHTYPAPVVQTTALLQWIDEHGATHGVDVRRMAIGGLSAGGNIAAAAVLANRDGAAHPISLQLLEVPYLDQTGGHLDRALAWELKAPKPAMRAVSWLTSRLYLSGRDQAREPLASPLLAADLSGLPPTVILAAGVDPLRGDATAYAQRLNEAGSPATALTFQGLPHNGGVFTQDVPAAREWHEIVLMHLRRLHEGPARNQITPR